MSKCEHDWYTFPSIKDKKVCIKCKVEEELPKPQWEVEFRQNFEPKGIVAEQIVAFIKTRDEQLIKKIEGLKKEFNDEGDFKYDGIYDEIIQLIRNDG